MFKDLITFFTDSYTELRRKVTWPGRREVYGTTIVVLVAVAIFSVFLGTVDIILFRVIRKVFSLIGG